MVVASLILSGLQLLLMGRLEIGGAEVLSVIVQIPRCCAGKEIIENREYIKKLFFLKK